MRRVKRKLDESNYSLLMSFMYVRIIFVIKSNEVKSAVLKLFLGLFTTPCASFPVDHNGWKFFLAKRTRIMSHPPGTLRFRIFSFHATHDIPRRAHNSFFSSVPSNLPIFLDPCNLTGCLLSGYANNDARRKPVRSRRADRREREKARERERERERAKENAT